jgi:hypothetical protein
MLRMPRNSQCVLCAIVVFCALLITSRNAAAQTHLWSDAYGSTAQDEGQSVTVDASGNVIVTGVFGNSVDFGGGSIASAGGSDAFLAKYNSSGAHVWSQALGGTGNDEGMSVDVDALGNVYVAGWFVGTANFGGAPIVSKGSLDVFLAKYDAGGAHLWSLGIGGTGIDLIGGISVDGSGNVFITGTFGPTGPLESDDIFLRSYSPTGSLNWGQVFGSTGEDRGLAVSADGSGSVFATGYFGGSVDFGGGALTATGGDDIYLAKYSASGAHLWSQRFGNTGDDHGLSVCADTSGNVIVTGHYTFAVDFGGGPLPAVGGDEVFLAKYDASGAHVWSRGFAGASDQQGRSASVDAAGNVFLTGTFVTGLDVGGGALSWVGQRDIFLAAFDPSGGHVWSQGFGDAGEDEGLGISADASGNVHATGFFNGTVDFGGGGYTSAGAPDVWVAKYAATSVTAATPSYNTALLPNSPNPFNPTTTIRFTLEKPAHATLSVFDARGRHVTTLLDAARGAVPHAVRWDGADDRGASVSSGVYFYRLEAGATTLARKMVLVK